MLKERAGFGVPLFVPIERSRRSKYEAETELSRSREVSDAWPLFLFLFLFSTLARNCLSQRRASSFSLVQIPEAIVVIRRGVATLAAQLEPQAISTPGTPVAVPSVRTACLSRSWAFLVQAASPTANHPRERVVSTRSGFVFRR